MSFVGDFVSDIFGGSEPEQTGTAISPGQVWLQQLLQPMLQRGVSRGMGGQQLYPTAGLPHTPHAKGYSAPQAPYSSPSDYLGQYQDTAQNAMEQFWGGGGGGSAMGGYSGSGVDEMARITDYATRNATMDYNQAMLPYAQMQNQASMFGAGAQNQMNTMGYSGGLQQMGAQNQAYGAPWILAGMYSGSTGSPMVQQGSPSLGQNIGSMIPYLPFMFM